MGRREERGQSAQVCAGEGQVGAGIGGSRDRVAGRANWPHSDKGRHVGVTRSPRHYGILVIRLHKHHPTDSPNREAQSIQMVRERESEEEWAKLDKYIKRMRLN